MLYYKKGIKSPLNTYRDALLKKAKAFDKINNRLVCLINLLLKLFKKVLLLISIHACYEALFLDYFHAIVHDIY